MKDEEFGCLMIFIIVFVVWLIGYGIKRGYIADDDLGGIVAQMECNKIESECLLDCLPNLEEEDEQKS